MKILVISAHPDDETLGCGGTILRHRAESHDVYWAVVSAPYEPVWTADEIERRNEQINNVKAAYGIAKDFHLGFPAAALDTVPQGDLMEAVGRVVLEICPDSVYLIHAGDVHSDHRSVFSAAMSVLKPILMTALGIRRVLSFETISSTDAAPPGVAGAFVPNVFVDISPYLDRKIEIMSLYRTEVQPDPLPRGPGAIQALARFRGGTIGKEYAEAFMLLREIS